MMNTGQVFQELLSFASPSGSEQLVADYIKKKVHPYADKIFEDARGNLLCYKYATTSMCNKTIAFIAHMDQIGMMITFVEDSGLIRFATIGAVDPQSIRGRLVQILHENTIIYGVVGSIPVHMRKDCEKKDFDVSELWIDIGTCSKEETLSKVNIGDYVTWYSPSLCLNDDIITGCACDNKAGVTALIKAMEIISETVLKYNIVFVFSTQEEIGSKGISTAIKRITPDVSIVVDVGHATDYPCVKKAKYGNIKVGGGCIIPFGLGINKEIQSDILQSCLNNNYPYQNLAMPDNSGTDANMIEKIGMDCSIGMILIPCRHMHSPVEMISVKDIDTVGVICASYCSI